MSNKHANISIFVPHMGCPNRCSFCNQNYISGKTNAPEPEDVVRAVEIAIKSPHYDPMNTEIAFFGGSFTAIERSYMCSLLSAAKPFVENKTVRGIRISTRPDAINCETLDLLKNSGVTAIELGAQSMDDAVLKINRRGHCADDVRRASELIKNAGFELGLQMMTGLLSDTAEGAIKTAQELINLKPVTVRIYPAIILEKTELAERYSAGEYIPQTIDQAAELCIKLLEMFENANIKVIRLGLHSIDIEHYVAGPFHPAFSEIVISKRYLADVLEKIKVNSPGKYIIFVAPGCVSKMVGQRRCNMDALEKLGFRCVVKEDPELSGYQTRIIKE